MDGSLVNGKMTLSVKILFWVGYSVEVLYHWFRGDFKYNPIADLEKQLQETWEANHPQKGKYDV